MLRRTERCSTKYYKTKDGVEYMMKNTTHTLNIFYKMLSANSIGVWKNVNTSSRVTTEYVPKFFCNTANFPGFEKHIFKVDPGISYHLTGYGILRNEAMIRFLGESAERYTFSCIYKILEKSIVQESYENLNKKENSLVVPLEYINIYESMNVESDTIISWVRMQSFVEEVEYVYVPAALVIMGWGLLKDEETNRINAVSTGTACHQTIEKALFNATVEYLQLDSSNLWWQCGFKGKHVSDNLVKEICNDMGVNKRFWEKFDIKVSDISFDKPINIYACEIYGKEQGLPQYAIGIQGGIDIYNSIYRGILEGLTILEYAYNYKFINEEGYNKVNREKTNDFYDLDKNAIYYAKYGKSKIREKECCCWNQDKIKQEGELFQYVKNTYRYAGFLDITPYDVRGVGFYIGRVIIPELIPLYLPSSIPQKHPRFQEYEVINYDPHPMP